MPKVSVVIPTYNRLNSLLRALESVFAQTYQDFEVVIVEDGSSSCRKDELSRFGDRVRYFWQSNAGVAAARNRGIRECRGEYIAFLDDDDFWAPEKLAKEVKVLDENQNVGLVYSRMQIVDETGKACGLTQESGNNFYDLLVKGGHYPTSTVMVRRKCFEKAGLFDETLPVFEDFDMWLRIARCSKIREITELTLGYYVRTREQKKRDQILVLESKIKLHRKILSSYQDIPKKQNRIFELSKYVYLLSKAYYKEGENIKSLLSLRDALFLSLCVGKGFIAKSDSFARKLLKSFQPYLLLLLLLFLSIKDFFRRKEPPGRVGYMK